MHKRETKREAEFESLEIDTTILEKPEVKKLLPPLQLAVRTDNMPRIEQILHMPEIIHQVDTLAQVVLNQIEWLKEDIIGKQESLDFINQQLEKLEQQFLNQAQTYNISVQDYIERFVSASQPLASVYAKWQLLKNKQKDLEQRIDKNNQTIEYLENLLSKNSENKSFIPDIESLD